MRVSNSVPKTLQDVSINIKLKLSALWAAVMFCYVYGDYIEVYVPGVMSNAMLVEANSSGLQLKFFAVALLMSIPSLMIFLSLVLKPKINRRLNIVLPALFVLLLVVLNLETAWFFYLYLTGVEILLSLTTIWFAWHWPVNEMA